MDRSLGDDAGDPEHRIADPRSNPFVRNPKLAALLGVPPAIVVLLVVPGTVGLVVGLGLLIVDPLLLFSIFKRQHDAAFGPESGHHQGPIVG